MLKEKFGEVLPLMLDPYGKVAIKPTIPNPK